MGAQRVARCHHRNCYPAASISACNPCTACRRRRSRPIRLPAPFPTPVAPTIRIAAVRMAKGDRSAALCKLCARSISYQLEARHRRSAQGLSPVPQTAGLPDSCRSVQVVPYPWVVAFRPVATERPRPGLAAQPACCSRKPVQRPSNDSVTSRSAVRNGAPGELEFSVFMDSSSCSESHPRSDALVRRGPRSTCFPCWKRERAACAALSRVRC